MATRERAVDRGNSAGVKDIRRIGDEIRQTRRSRGLSLRAVAAEADISSSSLSRIERAKVESVSLVTLARLCAIVGLDLSARVYSGGAPLRDARHSRVLEKLHGKVYVSLGWGTEVPLPNPGDQRAWDALIRGDGWRYGVEAELNPTDGQDRLSAVSSSSSATVAWRA